MFGQSSAARVESVRLWILERLRCLLSRMQEHGGNLAHVQVSTIGKRKKQKKPDPDLQSTMSTAFALKRGGKLGAAIATVEQFLGHGKRSRDSLSDALGFLGSLHEDDGDLKSAKECYLKALEMCEAPTYSKYTLEIALGNLSEATNRPEQAVVWYLRSLKTSQAGKGISAGTALFSLFSLRRPSELEPRQLLICRRVVRSSWKLLKIPGRPPLERLKDATQRIVRAQSQPRTKGREVEESTTRRRTAPR